MTCFFTVVSGIHVARFQLSANRSRLILQGYHPQQYPGYWVRTKPPRRAFHANDDPCDPAWRRIMSTVGPWGLLDHNLQDGPVVSPGRQWNSLKDKVSHSIDASWDCCGCPKKDFCPDPDGPESRAVVLAVRVVLITYQSNHLLRCCQMDELEVLQYRLDGNRHEVFRNATAHSVEVADRFRCCAADRRLARVARA